MSNGNILVAGIDDGFDETKIVLGDGTAFRMPSRAKAGDMNRIDISGRGGGNVHGYITSEGRFVVGPDIDRADATASDEYPVSAMNRAIVTHALRCAEVPGGAQVMACSGLPVKKFYRRHEMNTAFVNAKTENLLKNDIRAVDGAALPQIVRHEVVSEGIAAWMDYILERGEDGRLVVNDAHQRQRIGIVDIGGRTTDIAVIREWQLDTDRSSTVEVGMIMVRETVREAIADAYDYEPADEALADAMTSGEITLWGRRENVSELVSSAVETAVNRIRSETKRRLGNGADLDQVVFVGGTVVALAEHLKGWFPNQVIGTDPSFANARGMAKFAEFLLAAE